MTGYRSYRQLRIFVSSTFQDMLEERNILVSKVFPVIAEYCHRRKVEFIGVDLRWGVTDEQAERGETVDICMSEIDKCRPLFIGMLGERYGWVPDGNIISVTEQEILYGALEAPENTQALFYLRDPELTRKICGDFVADERQDDLKDRIRASRYPVMDGYADLSDFEAQLISDLKAMIDRIVSAEAPISAEEDRRMQQRFIAERHAAGHVRREELTAQLDKLADASGLVLVTGESGMGKTSLVSDWALGKIREPDSYVFLYYAGSADEKGWEQMCRQLTAELKAECGIRYPEADTAAGLVRAAHIMLNMAAAVKRLILVIDQPEALDDVRGQGMAWLPEKLPEGVTVVITADESETLRRLRLRSHSELKVGRLSSTEVTHIAEEYLAAYSKSLGTDHLAMLEACEYTRDPLYLITLLNEARHTGRHEELTEQLGDYLESHGIGELFGKVLGRIDSNYDVDGTGLPRRVLSLMEACSSGIAEAELISILGDIPQAKLAPLRLALEDYTVVNNGAMHICVPEFRRAVLSYYDIDEECLQGCRSELAEWFTAHTDTPRRNYVLPQLLSGLGRAGELYEVLSDPACFAELWSRDRYELKRYWAELIREGFSPADAYGGLVSGENAGKVSGASGVTAEANEDTDPGLLIDMAEFLAGTGAPGRAKEILEHLTGFDAAKIASGGAVVSGKTRATVKDSIASTGNNASGTIILSDDSARCRALCMLGNIYQREGQPALAAAAYRAGLVSARKAGDRSEQQRAFGNIGIISMMQGEAESAQKAFENVRSLAVRLNNKDAEQKALGNLGNIAFAGGELGEAERLYSEQLRVSELSGNTAGAVNALGALGVLHLKTGRLDAAEREFTRQEEASVRIGADDMLANALGNRATVLDARGDAAGAEELLERKLEICRKEGILSGEQNALGNLITLKEAQEGGLEEALELARQRVDVTRRGRMIRQYAEALHQLAEIEEKLSIEEADTHRKKAEVIARQQGFKL